MSTQGTITAINGNMISVISDGDVIMNEVAFIRIGEKRLKSEVIRIQGNLVQLQVFEITKGLGVGDRVEFSGEMLSVHLGPGLLGQVYDGLQNPLPELAEQAGFFLERGIYINPLDTNKLWAFEPRVAPGDKISAGDCLGIVPEGPFSHRIMLPFMLKDEYTVTEVKSAGNYTINETIVTASDSRGDTQSFNMVFEWPVKRPIQLFEERLKPVEPMVSKIRLVDTFFPVAKGGTYCIPGPFGAGKTVLQQITSRHAEVDVVIIAACGERAGEVVETLKEFPELVDPKTGRSLMERTIIICNTSSMPVASREASVYTAVTLAEYYRQMGLDVLLMADSTSRWAQAMREMSGRLEEIPGEEAFPAYLESNIAAFYERAGIVRLKIGETGSVTIGGTVSPAGGNFEEPVTQATLKVVGAFHGLSRERSDARKYPAIHPIDSWSKYSGIMPKKQVEYAHGMLVRSAEIEAMMKVVGEEGVSIHDYINFQKGEFLDAVYFQQNSFDPVDASVTPERQKAVFALVLEILAAEIDSDNKEEARHWFAQLRQKFLDYNGSQWRSEEFMRIEKEIREMIQEKRLGIEPQAAEILEEIKK